MKLRQKIILLAITPLILALCAIAFAVRHQAILLAQQQRAAIESAYLASKEEELKHYVVLATHSISHLYESGRTDQATQDAAKNIISRLDYGRDDGYFFIYDMNGVSLMHPRKPELVGKNQWDLRDPEGNPTIQRLLARARAGGGFERYLWEKPSSQKVESKLGYVVQLERWGWMLGTGIYLDDVEAALAKIDAQSSRNIYSTMLWIAAITIASALVIALSGLALNISEHRVADAKLRVLAQRVVRSQEEERARLSRDLHDGISQWLVSIKLQVESGIAKLAAQAAGHPNYDGARFSFDRAAGQLNGVLGEVRRISHDLRPAILDDLGLAAALDHLAHEFAEHSALPTHFESSGETDGLGDVGNTVLFRIAQEALTNIQRHAAASEVHLRLAGDQKLVKLTVADNGGGFDVGGVAQNPKRGIGLRNMHERLEAIGGKLQLISSVEGTQVIATIPKIERS
jgi:two-component system NarL family sensor kinase